CIFSLTSLTSGLQIVRSSKFPVPVTLRSRYVPRSPAVHSVRPRRGVCPRRRAGQGEGEGPREGAGHEDARPAPAELVQTGIDRRAEATDLPHPQRVPDEDRRASEADRGTARQGAEGTGNRPHRRPEGSAARDPDEPNARG